MVTTRRKTNTDDNAAAAQPKTKQTKLARKSDVHTEDSSHKTDSNEVTVDEPRTDADAAQSVGKNDSEDNDKAAKPSASAIEQDASGPAAEASREPEMKETVADQGTKGTNVTQHGRIFFLYKPKVGVEHVKSVDDVSRFHMLLRPQSSEDNNTAPILLIVGRKFLPNPVNGRQPIWAFVKDVGSEEALSHLGDVGYETKTRGTQHVGEDRLIGEGAYALVKEQGEVPSKTQCFLVYGLEEPQEPGEVQKAFQLQKHGAFGFSVKNPQTGSGPGQGLKEGATYPSELQEKFGSRRWIPLGDPAFLAHASCELLLLMHKQDVPEGDVEELQDIAADSAKPEVLHQHPDEEAAKRLWEDLKVPSQSKDEKVDVTPVTGKWD